MALIRLEGCFTGRSDILAKLGLRMLLGLLQDSLYPGNDIFGDTKSGGTT
jgi:hypothetical protein